MNEAKKEADNVADRIVSFMTLKTLSYLSYTQTGVNGIPKPGKTATVVKEQTHLFDILGTPPTLDLQNLDAMDLSNLDDEQHGLLHRFAQAILYYTSNLPIDAFRELFAL